jgi:predicted nucleic acid-binding protein
MLVVADTTPLNYLILIEYIAILAPLYERVVIPSAVATELRHPKAPAPVRAWIAEPPPWCTIQQAQGQPDTALLQLDPGEREALLLVQALGADVFLTDDLEGREEAIYRGIAVTGTLGTLGRAALRGLIDLPTALGRLQTTTFYAPPEIIAAMLAQDAARKARPSPSEESAE